MTNTIQERNHRKMVSRIWEIKSSLPGSEYAELLSIYVPTVEIECSLCGRGRLPDLLLEWEDGSDEVGDFTSAGARIVCKESVATLIGRFKGWEARSIQFNDHPKLHKPAGGSRVRRIWLPYEGPPLVEVAPTFLVKDPAPETTFAVEQRCEACGVPAYKRFDGVEQWDSRGRRGRSPGKGLFVKESDLRGNDIFGLFGTGLVLATDRVRETIVSEDFSNVAFLEYGQVIS